MSHTFRQSAPLIQERSHIASGAYPDEQRRLAGTCDRNAARHMLTDAAAYQAEAVQDDLPAIPRNVSTIVPGAACYYPSYAARHVYLPL